MALEKRLTSGKIRLAAGLAAALASGGCTRTLAQYRETTPGTPATDDPMNYPPLRAHQNTFFWRTVPEVDLDPDKICRDERLGPPYALREFVGPLSFAATVLTLGVYTPYYHWLYCDRRGVGASNSAVGQ